MMKRFSRKWQIVCASILLLAASYGIVLACADGDWEGSESSNFTPEAFISDTTQSPFFYSWLFYNRIWFETRYNERFNDVNTADWNKYLKGSIDKESIDYLLNKANNQSIEKLSGFYSGKTLPDSIRQKVKGLDKGSTLQQDFIRYLSLAKRCEQFAVQSYYYWDEKPERPDQSVLGDLEQNLNSEFSSCNSSFLKERYWFQLIRYYYFYDKEKCISLFESSKHQFKPSNMYYRAMSYAAGAYNNQQKVAIANYYYSIVFDNCSLLKTVAHLSFHPQNEDDWQQTLSLCKNDEEKITLWQILGIQYRDEVRSMQEIYKLSPKSDKLDLLLVRFVNKTEVGLPYSEVSDSVKNVIAQDTKWCYEVADKGKVSNPFLWNISAGYLAFLAGDYPKSESYYRKASKYSPKDGLPANQLRLLSLLTKIKLQKSITASNEEFLLPDLKWLYTLSDQKNVDPNFRFTNSLGWVRQELSKLYMAQGDIIKAECFVTDNKFYLSNINVERFKTFLLNPKPSSFDKLCIELSSKKIADLYEYQAIRATFADSLTQAIEYMKKVGETAVLPGNPFIAHINDCHDCDHEAAQKYKINKLTFLERLKQIEDAIAAKKDVYQNALLAANAFYNISNYGNARAFYEGSVVSSDFYSPFDIPVEFYNMLSSNKTAKYYYQLAFKNAKSREQKAKALFMMAKCERNEWYNLTLYSNKDNEYNYDPDQKNFIVWDSFKVLRGYSDTKYYKEAIKECGYFRKSIGR